MTYPVPITYEDGWVHTMWVTEQSVPMPGSESRFAGVQPAV